MKSMSFNSKASFKFSARADADERQEKGVIAGPLLKGAP